MSDGSLNTTRGEGTELDRLRRLYDGLLADPSVPLAAEAQGELAAMARIFDLDADRPPAEIWRDLRAVLTRHAMPRREGDHAFMPAPPLTLLVVEDDPAMAADLVDVLVDAGHGVIGPFSDAAAAAAAAAHQSIDLALVDINLVGNGDGIGLARTLTEAWGVPVIFLSGDVAAAAAHARLAVALVLKPYGRRDVLQALARAVANGAVAA
ncbi:MAG: response regulator [Brevundimonas sp.]